MARLLPPDGSRDPRVEDPTNRWIVHLAGRILLPLALRWRLSANSISITGLIFGTAASWSVLHWNKGANIGIGFLLCTLWLVADGLDGMVARATGTASAIGRALDGMCDHGVFLLLYIGLAFSIGSLEACLFAAAAGIAHAVQSSLYEGERTRFHRRLRGDPGRWQQGESPNPLVRLYDRVASAPDRLSDPFDQMLRSAPDPCLVGQAYGEAAAPALKLMWVLSANMRVLAIFLACAAGNPKLFFWLELIPFTFILVAGMVWHRGIEKRLVRRYANTISTPSGFAPL